MRVEQTVAQLAQRCPSMPLGNLGNVDCAGFFGPPMVVAQVAQRLFEKRFGQWSKTRLKSTLPGCPGCPPSTRGCRCRAIGPESLGGDRRPGRVSAQEDQRAYLHRLKLTISSPPPRSGGVIDEPMRFIAAGDDRITVTTTRARVTAYRDDECEHYARASANVRAPRRSRIAVNESGDSLDEQNGVVRTHPSRATRSQSSALLSRAIALEAKRSN